MSFLRGSEGRGVGVNARIDLMDGMGAGMISKGLGECPESLRWKPTKSEELK